MSVTGMLKEATGLNLPRGQVERAIRERMAATGQTDRKQYAHELAHGLAPDELAQLVELVVVPESWLFRDPQAFAVATEFVKVRLARGAKVVRILSLPCAGGEEPYSMAMALCDACVPLESFAIDAVDISAGCVSRAAQGIFGRNAFRTQDLGFRERYFTPLEGTDELYQIASSLQQRVRFRQGNVLAEGAAPSVSYDIVFCRNLLIYFDRPTATVAAARLSSLLSDDGILFAGYAEVPVFTQNGFVPLPHRNAFAMRKALAQPGDSPAWAALPGAAPLLRRASSAAAAHRAPPSPAASLTPAAAPSAAFPAAPGFAQPSASAPSLVHARLAPRLPAGAAAWPNAAAPAAPSSAASTVAARAAPHLPASAATWSNAGHFAGAAPGSVPDNVASASGAMRAAPPPRAGRASLPAGQSPHELPAASAADLLAQARQLADHGKLNEAAAACRNVLASAPETAEAYFILALLSEAEQNPEDTKQHLKRCLYLKPDHYEALCHLALLVEQGGNRNAAAHLKARAARVYQRQHASQ